MPNSTRLISSTHLLALSLLTGIGVAGYAVNKYGKPFPVVAASTAVLQQKPEILEVERVTIRPAGFEITQISRLKKNPFFLIVENRTGLTELSFQLNKENGQKAIDKDLKSPQGKKSWNGVVDLPPGNYTLTEINHKEWSLAITIENK
jgi:hypothetical protein